ncbi:MAG: hypothetical protein PVJ76_00650 [Gemmatimonadota bacterium]|jgi:hypothetical protein
MTDIPIEDRHFTDEEVREILKRAVEKAPSRALAKKSDGLSLADLKTIGEEVGIDPARLEDAARSVALGKRRQPNVLVGGPTVLNFQRRVDGEFDPKDTPDILGVIRKTMGVQGEVDEIHGSLEWRAEGDMGERYVTLSPREGTTTITGSANLSNAAVLTYLPTGIVGIIASMVGLIKFAQDGTLIGLLVALTVLPVLYTVLRTVYGKISGAESAKLQRVVDELARLTAGGPD